MRIRFASAPTLVLALATSLALVLAVGGCARRPAADPQLGLDAGSKAPASAPGQGEESTSGAVIDEATKTASAEQGGSGPGAQGGSGAAGSGSQGGSNAGSGGSGSGSQGGTAKPASKTVRILWWNDTVRQPVKSPEVVFEDSVYKPASGKSDVGSVGPAAVGRTLTLIVYPDGRSGKAVKASFEVTAQMMSNSDVDAIHVEVSDTQVRVLGNPIPNFVQAYKR